MDVNFIDTVKKPMDVVRQVYDFIGWKPAPAAERAMQAWLAEDDKSHGAGGAHDYSPEQFGLSAEQLKRDFAQYRERHVHAA